MGILTKEKIKKKIETGDIFINPFNASNLNPNSYDLTLDSKLLVYKNEILDTRTKNEFEEIFIDNDDSGFILEPNRLYLASTVEYTKTYNLVPIINGKSSLGRLGLFVHVTAGFGDVGFCGNWTLELNCIHPIRIYKGMKICQIYYNTIEGVSENYSGKYSGVGVQPSFNYKDFIINNYGLNNG